jgi:hypothetical protein
MILYPITIPGGSDTHVQYNNGGIFGGDATFNFNDTTKVVDMDGLTCTGSLTYGIDLSSGTWSSAVMNWDADPDVYVNGIRSITLDNTNYNIFLGYNSFGDEFGQYNVGIGYETGLNNDEAGVSGRYNTYIGYHAGKGDTPATDNSGRFNFALGYRSLVFNTTGSFLVAIGSTSLLNNTTGNYHVAIGNDAQRTGTNLQRNVSIGYNTLYYNNAGSDSVVIGDKSGQGASGKYIHRSVLLGSSTAYGAGNIEGLVCVGYKSGYSLTTGSDSIFLGNLSGYNQTTTGDLLIIDNQDRGSAAAEITDCLMYGVFNATPASQTLRFNLGNLYLGNPTHSDADGGGAIIQSFIREDGAGTASTAATITGSHDGAGANDTDGKLVLATNLDGTGLVDRLKIDSAGNTYIGDAGTTNYTKIEADGTVEFNGTATVWNDANVGAAMLSLPAASVPDEDEFVDEAGADTGISTWAYAIGEKSSGTIEIPHDYKEGSDIYFHIHWQGITAPGGGTDNVNWQLTYTVAQKDETLDAPTTITKEIAIDVQYDFKLSDFAAITGTNFNIGDQFLFTIERIAASADDYAGDCLVATVGFHYEVDTVGSRQITTK